MQKLRSNIKKAAQCSTKSKLTAGLLLFATIGIGTGIARQADPGANMAEPQITISSPLEAIGVRLLSSASPEFKAALPQTQDKTFDSLLRYSAMLKNDTSKSILAYTILWICTDSDGKVGTPVDAWFDFSNFPSPTHLSAHSSKFVTVLGPDVFDSPITDPSVIDNSALQFFHRQKTIEIALSAVLFDDGTAAGPDTRGWISRWRSYFSAEHDVFLAASTSGTGDLETVMSKFVHDASTLAKPFIGHTEPGDLNDGHLFQAFTHADTFEQQYSFFAGYSAARVLMHLHNTDESTTRNKLATVLETKHYPKVKQLGGQ